MSMDKKSITYMGWFTENQPGVLDKQIANQHVTAVFQPCDSVYLDLLQNLGQECEIGILGYGNDGKNEGLLVQLHSDLPYRGAEKQHITLSISKDGKAVNTAFLDFDKEIPEHLGLNVGDRMNGKLGAFVVRDTPELQSYEHRESSNKFTPHPVFNPELFADYRAIGKDMLVQRKDAPRAMEEYLAKHCLDNDGYATIMSYVDTNSITFKVNTVGAKEYGFSAEQFKELFADLKELHNQGYSINMTVRGCFYVPTQDALLDLNMETVSLNFPDEMIVEDGMFVAMWDDGHVLTNVDFIDTYLDMKHQMDISKQIEHNPNEEAKTQADSDSFNYPQIGE